MAPDNNEGQALFAQAEALPDKDRLLLQLAAVIYEPVATSFLCRAFLTLAPALLDDRRTRYDEAAALVTRLRERGLLSEQNQCDPALAELLVRQSIREKRFARLVAFVERNTPMDYQHGRLPARCWRALRQFRIGLYSQNGALVEENLAFLEQREARLHFQDMSVARILTCAFDPAWFAAMPGFLQFLLLDHLARRGVAALDVSPDVERYLEEEVPRRMGEAERVPFLRLLAQLYIARGKARALADLLAKQAPIFNGTGLAGAAAFLAGRNDEALALFRRDLAFLREVLGGECPGFPGLPGFFCAAALLRAGGDAEIAEARAMLAGSLARAGEEEADALPLRCLAAFAAHLQGETPDLAPLVSALAAEEGRVSLILALIVFFWLGVAIAPEYLRRLRRIVVRAESSGYAWPAREARALLRALDAEAPEEARAGDPDGGERDGGERDGARPPALCRLFTPEADWQQSLAELIEAAQAVREADPVRRLAWFVRFEDGALSLLPKEQRKNAQGRWSAGRNLTPARLAAGDQPWFTRQDRELRAALTRRPNAQGGGDAFVFDPQKALPALIGHPRVFLRESPKTPVEIVAAEPELMVERRGDMLFLHFSPPVGAEEYSVWPETATRFKVVRIREEHRRVAAITGPSGLQAPLAASEEVLAAIGRLTSVMTVHSAIDMPGADEGLPEVLGDSTPHIQIIPLGTGFRLDLFVRPFGKVGPYLKPGVGAANLIAEIEGRRLKARRDLPLERERAREVEESCPILDLATDLETEVRREWRLSEADECLQVLLELDAIRDRVVLEWPEGVKLAIRRIVGPAQLNLNIRGIHQDWFALSGQVHVDEDVVVDLRFLLDQARQSKSRFIPLGEGQFLALTQEFRNRLDELLYYGSMENGELRVHALAALALEELDRTADTTADEAWARRREAVRGLDGHRPEPPATLKASLRDYQKEGFVWMSRMAALGFGACLADDMGLGKTIQALALILSRAPEGPTLVVAPTSVCMNWQAEIRRFAPTLTAHMLADLPRDGDLPGFAAFDVLIASYTLLQQEKKKLAAPRWRTIVLDEAQAIKNAATKRSQAAMGLNGAFRLITTGTPIENHLGELWNLFAFINPGLLGTFKQFNRRYGIPIEKHHDRAARRMLKKLIRPFMLRRIKAEVLDELPPRTEVSLSVDLSQDERNFYEALRQEALEHIESGGDQSVRQLRILAEIMRLRRACCNPSLVRENSGIVSSKEELFMDLVDGLIAGGHKALVFSQFTGHLAFLRRRLDARDIGYCYLDGSTPAAQRRVQVEAFQSGGAALFLISLKAGGLGLNLTAADYVIHMDPWWNPAVEDQAADRAHRIGQTRPVTVYRLVTTNTIEEKIVQLHREKRDLAHSLLEGTDLSARVGVEELLELIRGG